MARLRKRQIDQYKAGTRQKRGYMCDMSSIYRDDCMTDAAIFVANTIDKSIVAMKRDDTEFELNDFE